MSRPTQDTTIVKPHFVYGIITLSDRPFQTYSTMLFIECRGPTTPCLPKQTRFGLIPFRSPLLRESLLFSLPAPT